MGKRKRGAAASTSRSKKPMRSRGARKTANPNPATDAAAKDEPKTDASAAMSRAESVRAQEMRQLEGLQQRVSTAIEIFREHKMNLDGQSGEVVYGVLESVLDALAKRSVVHSVQDLPEVPKLLLYCSKDTESLLDERRAKLVCNCLLMYMRPSSDTIQTGVVRRASTWAAELLRRLVSGDDGHGDACNEYERKAENDPLPFCPQDILQEECARQLGRDVLQYLREMPVSSHDACNRMYRVFEELAPLLAHDCAPSVVVAAALRKAASLPVPLERGENASDVALPDAFTCHFKQTGSGSPFASLDADSAARLLQLSPSVLEAQLSYTRSYLASAPETISHADERNAVYVFARAVCYDVSIFWRIADDTHAAVASTSDAFQLDTWRGRRFARAFADCCVELLAGEKSLPLASESSLHSVPWHQRFHPDVRQLVTSILQHSRSIQASPLGVCIIAAELERLHGGQMPTDGMVRADAMVVLVLFCSELQITVSNAMMAAAINSNDSSPVYPLALLLCVLGERGTGNHDTFSARVNRVAAVLRRALAGHSTAPSTFKSEARLDRAKPAVSLALLAVVCKLCPSVGESNAPWLLYETSKLSETVRRRGLEGRSVDGAN